MNKFIKLTIAIAFAAIFAVPVAVQAKKVEPEKAERLAKRFVESKHGSRGKAEVRLKHVVKKQRQRYEQDAAHYYVFNINEDTGGGFVVIAGDDAVKPVLGYSDNGNYNEDNLPANFAYWMDYLQQQIAWVQEQNIIQSEAVKQEWDDYISEDVFAMASTVSPLIQTQWNQREPYNNMVPSWSGQRSVTGCVATAMAQIMKYYNHPVHGNGQSNSYITATHGITVPSQNFGATYYDWGNMRDSYSGSYTPQEGNAVATLMYHAGVSVEMDYSLDGSGAQTSKVLAALTTHFGYDNSIEQVQRASYGNADWEAILTGQIDIGMPVYYSGRNPSSGHAFILDGYDNTGKFHFNWGWGGLYDGYFVTNALNPGTGGAGAGSGTYNQDQVIIINIKPNGADAPPTIIAHPSNQTVYPGNMAQFTVEAEPNGAGSLTYQWQVSKGTIPVTDTIMFEDFEGSNSFILVNGSEANEWVVGTATAYGGTKSAYISNDGTSNAYTTTSPSIVHMYRDITFPVFEVCTLSFNFKGIGEANYDYLSIRWAETSVTPMAGSELASWNISSSLSGFEYSSWIRIFIPVPTANSGNTKRLVFTWRNNASGGVNPPIAVDNITIAATVTKTGEGPFRNVIGGISATYTIPIATEEMNGDRYRCIVKSNNGLPGTSNIATLTVSIAATPTITEQPAGGTVTVGGTHALNVLANTSDGGTLSYQWYSNTVASNSGGTEIIGAISSLYNIPTCMAGIFYYYVIVTNTVAGKSVSQTSSVAMVAVDKAAGFGTVAITDWVQGQSPNTPIPSSATNGVASVTYHYKVQGANDATYTKNVPAEAGNYTVRVTFAETANYLECKAMANFTIFPYGTPIRSPQIASVGDILAYTIGNTIVLQNLPSNAKVEVFDLKGMGVAVNALTIPVQVKGMYIVKVSFGSERKILKVAVR